MQRFGGMAIACKWAKIATNVIYIKRCVMESSETKQALFWVWVITALVILLSLVLSGRGYACDDDYYSDLSRSERRIANDMERRYLRRNGHRCLRFKGDTEIDRDESIKGDIVVLKGTVEIDGEIDGTVLSLFGDVELGENAYVTGDVISVNGKVWRDRESVVRGDIVETDLSESRRQRYARDDDDRAYVEKRSRRRQEWNPCRHVDLDFPRPLITYDRVDGLTLGMRLPPRAWWRCNRHRFAVLGKGGYSFASKRWQYQIGLERGIVEDFGLSIGAELHDVTETQDRWIMDDEENSLAAALLKEDFRDYYRRDGYTFYAVLNMGDYMDLTVEYNNDDFTDLENNTNWALFGTKKQFRPNPMALPIGFVREYDSILVQEPTLEIQSIGATFTLDSRNDNERPTRGWYINASAERAGGELDSDMNFERYIVDIRKYIPMGWDENLDIRVRGGTSSGLLPPMYWFDLGGISTLRGFRFKEFTGDRMVLGNVEYRMNTSEFNGLGLDVDLILFVDSGAAWFADADTPYMLETWPIDGEFQKAAEEKQPKETFESLTWGSLKTNVGIGVAFGDGVRGGVISANGFHKQKISQYF
jgi:hypothetical protein